MAARREGLKIHVGGKAALGLFALSLIGFVAESQLTQVSRAFLMRRVHRADSGVVLANHPGVPTSIPYFVRTFTSCRRAVRGFLTHIFTMQLYTPLLVHDHAATASRVPCHRSTTVSSGAMRPTDYRVTTAFVASGCQNYPLPEEKARLAPRTPYHRCDSARVALVHRCVISTVRETYGVCATCSSSLG